MFILNNKKKTKILIATGGTGGHVFPAISLAEELISKKQEIVFLSDTRVKQIILQNKKLFKKKPIKFYILYISNNLRNFFFNILSFLKIFGILYREKPNIVVGFGGYTSFPILLASKIFFKTIILHEQNIEIGFTNKLFIPFSKKIVVGLGEKKDLNFVYKKKYIFIRNPVRKRILYLRKKVKLKFKKNKINLLIIGGSQGAKILGEKIPEALNLLPKKIKNKICIYHQCPKNDILSIKRKYFKMKLNSNCKTFFTNLPDIMFKSHLIISRAGASSLSEISSLGRPVILIPYKYAKNNHQIKNAQWFANNGAAEILREDKFDIQKLKKKIMSFLGNYKKLEKMSKKSYLLADSKGLEKFSNLICDLNK